MNNDTKEIVDTLNLILTRMATNDDVASMATKDDIEGANRRSIVRLFAIYPTKELVRAQSAL